VDAHRFERLAADGAAALRAGDARRAADTLREALALWRGRPLADLTSRPLVAAAAHLEDVRATALAAASATSSRVSSRLPPNRGSGGR
jgi:hypothetical protein